jgi:hypothetical protein
MFQLKCFAPKDIPTLRTTKGDLRQRARFDPGRFAERVPWRSGEGQDEGVTSQVELGEVGEVDEGCG